MLCRAARGLSWAERGRGQTHLSRRLLNVRLPGYSALAPCSMRLLTGLASVGRRRLPGTRNVQPRNVGNKRPARHTDRPSGPRLVPGVLVESPYQLVAELTVAR